MGEKKVYVTRQFIEKFLELFASEDVSFGDIAKLLVFQPFFVAHLLQVANQMCARHGSFKKPTSIQAIINILGLNKVADEIECLEYAPLEEERSVLDQSMYCYILGSVYACLAEEMFGKKKAPDHFLAGLIAPLVRKDPSIIEGCHEELGDYFVSTYTHGLPIEEGVSTIAHLEELIKGFNKKIIPPYARGLCEEWYHATQRAHGTLVVYSGTFLR